MMNRNCVFAWALIAATYGLCGPASAGEHLASSKNTTPVVVHTTATADAIHWINVGDGQMAADKYADAAYSYTAAIVKGVDTPEIYAKRGQAHYWLGNYKYALENYNEAIARDASRSGYFNQRGLIRYALQDYGLAIADFRQSLKLAPNNAEVLTNRAGTYAHQGDIRRARQDLDAALSLKSSNPNYAPAHVYKAWLWLDGKQPEKAVLEMNKLEQVAALGMDALEVRATARLALADWRGAEADADRAITLGQKDFWPFQIRVQARLWLGDYQGALADADELLRRFPANGWSMGERSMALQLAGHTDAAIAEMDRAIKNDINRPQALQMRSFLNLNAGRMKEAFHDAQLAAGLDPKSPVAISHVGLGLIENGDPAAGEKECSRSLAITETLAAYFCRGTARLILKKYAAARKDAERARIVDKTSGTGLYLLGRIDLALGKPAKALEEFDQAAKLSIYNQAGLFMYRGDAEKARGNIDKARAHYQTAQKFDLGRFTEALSRRLASLPGQQKSGP